jgi:hypothetical protein
MVILLENYEASLAFSEEKLLLNPAILVVLLSLKKN